jgi:ATP/maltotriose-dependent transcriptional regulator MalT
LTLALARGHEARLSPSEMAALHLQIATAHFALGHDDEAAALVAEVERSALVRGERSLSQRRIFVALAFALLALGKPKQAEYYLQAVESSLTPVERQSRYYYPIYLTARASLALALGQPAEARHWADKSRALSHQTSHVSLTAEAGPLFVLARTAPDRATGRKLGLQLLHDLERSDCTDSVVQRQLREWLRLPGPARRRP